MEWKHPQWPSKKKFKTQPSTGKLMLTVFWNARGSALEHRQDRGTTMWALQWDAYWQARACNSKQMPKTTLEGYCVVAWQCPSTYCCPPCWSAPETAAWSTGSSSVSPDLAPSHYHLFGPLKEELRGRRFTSKWRTQCMRGSLLSRKPFLRASGSLCIDGPSALKDKGAILKNDVKFSFLFALQKKL